MEKKKKKKKFNACATQRCKALEDIYIYTHTGDY